MASYIHLNIKNERTNKEFIGIEFIFQVSIQLTCKEERGRLVKMVKYFLFVDTIMMMVMMVVSTNIMVEMLLIGRNNT